MKRKVITLSLIFPLYNESDRFSYGLKRAIAYLSRQRYRWEIILVDDGSDPPLVVALTAGRQAAYHIRLFRLEKNSGKGAAIAEGVTHARGNFIVFSDIDLSVSIEHLADLLSLLKKYPVVIGSRRHTRSRIIVHQPVLRELSGRIFTWLSDAICGIGVSDATCGLKGFRKDCAKILFSKLTIGRWVFDVEILYLARKLGYSVKEMAVTWADRKGTKVRVMDSVGSFIDLLRIKWNDRKGVYEMRRL